MMRHELLPSVMIGIMNGTFYCAVQYKFVRRKPFSRSKIPSLVAQLILDRMVRNGTLIVNLSSTAIEGHPHVTEYRVMRADGQPLPDWLNRAGTDVLLGQRPADVAAVELRIVGILSDGTTIERGVTIQTSTGEIKPLNDRGANATPLFTEQLQAENNASNAQFDQLLKALSR